MAEEPTLPWSQVADPTWVPTVDGWPWRPLGDDDWGKSGPCPRCKAEITVQDVDGVFAFLARIHAPDLGLLLMADHGPIVCTVEKERQFFARCNCSEAHKGRPSGLKYGCGQAGFIARPPRDE